MPAGRPPKFKTPDELQHRIDLYFLAVRANARGDYSLYSGLSDEDLKIVTEIDCDFPTVTGLALALGLTRQGLIEYSEKNEKFSDTVKAAKAKVELALERRLQSGSAAGTIFNLKNNFGWKDKTETDITSGGKPVKNEWHIHPVTTDKDGKD